MNPKQINTSKSAANEPVGQQWPEWGDFAIVAMLGFCMAIAIYDKYYEIFLALVS